jgi:hypothetical protein
VLYQVPRLEQLQPKSGDSSGCDTEPATIYEEIKPRKKEKLRGKLSEVRWSKAMCAAVKRTRAVTDKAKEFIFFPCRTLKALLSSSLLLCICNT